MNRLTIAFCTLAYLLLVACGGGEGLDEIQPPIITNPNTLGWDVQLPIVETLEGGLLQVQRATTDTFLQCGRIKELRGYRTGTEVVFRIDEELGFCWPRDRYMIWITGIRWRGVPANITIFNNGDPLTDGEGRGGAAVQLVPSGITTLEPAIEVRQWRDDADDLFFYLAIPLDLFSFANESADARSVFNVAARLDRFTPDRANQLTVEIRDWTLNARVDFMDPN